MIKLDLNKINELIEEGYITSQAHPIRPIRVYKYTAKTEYERYWNEYTSVCRGIVLDEEGNVLSKPFNKFFNYGMVEQDVVNRIDSGMSYKIYEKLDGSFIKTTMYNNELIFSSMCSFTSDQALKAKELFFNSVYFLNLGIVEGLLEKYTFMFEVIYPENRIVLNYGTKEQLVLIGVIETATGKEVDISEFSNYFNTVKLYEEKTLEQILVEDEEGREGYVVAFEDGFRVKVKFNNYVLLHRVVTGLSNKSIYDVLATGQNLLEFLETIPDEYYDMVKVEVERLQSEYDVLLKSCYDRYNILSEVIKTGDRKEIAKEFTKFEYPFMLFAILDNNTDKAKKALWQNLKPTEYKRLIFGAEVEE